MGISVANGALSLFLFRMVSTTNTFINLVFGVFISFLVPFGVNFLVFGRTEEWKYCEGMVMNIVRKVVKRG